MFFLQPDVLKTWRFVILTFCKPDVLETWRFVNLMFQTFWNRTFWNRTFWNLTFWNLSFCGCTISVLSTYYNFESVHGTILMYRRRSWAMGLTRSPCLGPGWLTWTWRLMALFPSPGATSTTRPGNISATIRPVSFQHQNQVQQPTAMPGITPTTWWHYHQQLGQVHSKGQVYRTIVSATRWDLTAV